MKKSILKPLKAGRVLLLFIIIQTVACGQNINNETLGNNIMEVNNENNPCISQKEYQNIENECNINIKLFGLNNTEHSKITTPSLNWPLKQVNSLSDCSYYLITNNVDNNTTSGIQDYNCGTRTYNGHAGTDIVPQPYPFYKMDNNQVEVIAAASGTIVSKSDGNFDKNCVTGASPAQGNYIAVLHSDGSRTLYYHMKKNSLTSKIVGQIVVTGEFLGIVGSSGSSNIPHLHFEVWSGNTSSTFKDPFYGTCNSLIASSLWAVQKPYKDRGILKIQTNTIAPVLPSCGTTETPNEESCFSVSAGTARFYRWIRDDSVGLVTNMRIINPNGTTFDSWTGTSNTNFNVALYTSIRTLPTIAGIYTYEAIYNGNICLKSFTIDCTTTTIDEHNSNKYFSLYPNPSNGKIIVDFTESGIQLEGSYIILYNSLGEKIFEKTMFSARTEIELDVPPGMFFYNIENKNKIISKGKLIVN